MKQRFIISVILLAMSTLVHAQERPPFYGEWWPDSVVVNGEKVRQFIFVTAEGRFFRCSYDTERYLLDRNLSIEKAAITRKDGSVWQLSQPDSMHLILQGPDFYGRFVLDLMPHIISLEDGLKEFIVGDSVKQIILGRWKFKEVNFQVHDTTYIRDSEAMEMIKLRSLLWVPYDEELEIEFLKNNQVIAHSGNEGRKRKYIVDDVGMSFYMSDLYSTPSYKLHNDELWLIFDDTTVEWTYVFERK